MKNYLFRDYVRYAGLNTTGMLALSGYILADTFFVAQALGARGLAALNLSIPIYSLIHGLGLLLAMGGAALFTIFKARGAHQEALSVLGTALKSSLLVGALFAFSAPLAAEPLAALLGADAETLPPTVTYLSTILTFAPFFLVNNVLTAFARNDQQPKLAMLGMLVGSLANIILDYLFMFPLGMGMFGAAFATCLAPMVSISIVLPHFVRRGYLARILRQKLNWRLLPDLAALGFSAFISEVASAVVLITFNLVILSLEGNLGVAAYGIVANLALVAVAVYTGVAQGAQPLISLYHGQNKPELVREVGRYALGTSLVLAALTYGALLFWTDSVVAVFNSEADPAITRLAGTGLRLYFLSFFFAGINICAATSFSAAENTGAASVISLLRGVAVIVPAVLIFSRIWGMTGVWLSVVFTEFVVAAVAWGLQRNGAGQPLGKSWGGRCGKDVVTRGNV